VWSTRRPCSARRSRTDTTRLSPNQSWGVSVEEASDRASGRGGGLSSSFGWWAAERFGWLRVCRRPGQESVWHAWREQPVFRIYNPAEVDSPLPQLPMPATETGEGGNLS
jgi:hypothetical protein